MFRQEDIDRLMEQLNIVDVVGEFVELKKSGANYKGLCPFHADNNPSFSVNPQKNICKCFVCGKEKLVTCDKFGIYPPTEYGYRAYGGYWSAVSCDCHPISSFQWIVNDLLIKNGVDYKVEVEAEGVYGIDNETPLRFDFGIYK